MASPIDNKKQAPAVTFAEIAVPLKKIYPLSRSQRSLDLYAGSGKVVKDVNEVFELKKYEPSDLVKK